MHKIEIYIGKSGGIHNEIDATIDISILATSNGIPSSRSNDSKKKKKRNEQIYGKHENVSIVFQFNARLDIVYVFHSPTSLHRGL